MEFGKRGKGGRNPKALVKKELAIGWLRKVNWGWEKVNKFFGVGPKPLGFGGALWGGLSLWPLRGENKKNFP